MSERYTKLFELPKNLYAQGSPVVISAGALLKDNQTGKMIAQLKMRRISKKAIKAATVCITPYDTVGNLLGEAVRYQYLDLNVLPDQEFGQKAAIALPEAATRSFSVVVEDVAFTDNSVWTAGDEPWEVLPLPSAIAAVYGSEFEKQFKMKYGQNCKYLPLSTKDLWFCACGALNRQEDTNCCSCSKVCAEVSSYNAEELREETAKRLAQEKAQAEAEAAEKARIREENQKKAKKLAKIIVPTAIVVIIAIIAVSAFTATQEPKRYASAITMMTEGKYEEAAPIFLALGDYEDSTGYLLKIYDQATALLTEGNYEEASAIFTALGEYKDSAAMKEKAELAVWVVEQKGYVQFMDLAESTESIDIYYDPVKAHLILESTSVMELDKNTKLMRSGTEATLQGLAIRQYNTLKDSFAPFEEKGVTCIVRFISIAGGETYVGSSATE